MLRLIFAVEPPVQAKVQRYLTTCLVAATNTPPPPTPQGHIGTGIYLMQSLSNLNHLLMNMRRDLRALHREHVVIISLSHKVNAWRRQVTTAWVRPVRLARFLLCSSFIEATLHRKERMAMGLVAFHSLTLSYTSTHCLIHVLWGVY